MAIKYPIREMLGRYEAFVLKLYGSARYWHTDTKIERFLSFFPDNLGVESFTIADIADYRIWRIRAGVNRSTIEIELRCVGDWFKWMIEDCELPLFNPVKPVDHVVTYKPKNRLRLDDLKRLLDYASLRLREWILTEIADESHDGQLQGRNLQKALWDAANAADMDWIKSTAIFRAALNGLWKTIILSEHPKLKALFCPDVTPEQSAALEEEKLLAEAEAFNSRVTS